MAISFNPSDLNSEKSFFSIYKKARGFGWNTFNSVFLTLILIILLFYSCCMSIPLSDFVSLIRLLANKGFDLSLNILGFLLAGFTIYATMSKPRMFQALAVLNNDNYKISYLKYYMFHFMQVFLTYLAFSFLCLIITIFGGEKGLFSHIMLFTHSFPWLRVIIIKFGFVFLTLSYFYVLLQLKSLVFNIYSSIMASIRWDFEVPDDETKKFLEEMSIQIKKEP